MYVIPLQKAMTVCSYHGRLLVRDKRRRLRIFVVDKVVERFSRRTDANYYDVALLKKYPFGRRRKKNKPLAETEIEVWGDRRIEGFIIKTGIWGNSSPISSFADDEDVNTKSVVQHIDIGPVTCITGLKRRRCPFSHSVIISHVIGKSDFSGCQHATPASEGNVVCIVRVSCYKRVFRQGLQEIIRSFHVRESAGRREFLRHGDGRFSPQNKKGGNPH